MSMKFSGKRGFELAASTVVILIVSVVILAFSIYLIHTVVCSAEDLVVTVDGQSQREIERLLLSGQGRVIVADNTQVAQTHGGVICGSSAVKSATYALGIRNTQPDGTANFVINISGSTSESKDAIANEWLDVQYLVDTPLTVPAASNGYSYSGTVQNVPGGDVWSTNILMTATSDLLPGQYVFSVVVFKNSASNAAYGVQQIYLSVP